MATATPIQAVVLNSLSQRQTNSLLALQRKLDKPRQYGATTMHVSEAQMAALQAAWTSAKASGLPIEPELAQVAARLGLK